MRLLGACLLATSGCALVDAAGASKAGGGDQSYTRSNIPNTTQMARSIAVAELNGTPQLDVVVVGNDGRFIVCVSQGSPTYFVPDPVTVEPPRPSPADYRTLGRFDLDGDQRDDIVVAGMGVLDVMQPDFLGIDPPKFKRTDLSALIDQTHVPTKIVAGRLPLSPMPSIVVMYQNSDAITVISDPLNLSPTAQTLTGINAADIAIGNVNSGTPDAELLVGDLATNRILEFSGSPLTSRTVTLNEGNGSVMAMTVGDFGADGQFPDGGPDLAFAEQRQNEPNIGRVYYGSGNGLATSGQAYGETMGRAVTMTTADLDGDARADVVVLTQNPSELRLFFQGQTAFPTERRIELDIAATTMAAGDLDGDGVADLLVGPGLMGGIDLFLTQ